MEGGDGAGGIEMRQTFRIEKKCSGSRRKVAYTINETCPNERPGPTWLTRQVKLVMSCQLGYG